MKHARKIIPISLLALTLIIGVTIFWSLTRSDMREIKSFKYGICQAAMPECGVCPGEVVNDKCYVKHGTYEQYR